MNKYIISVLLIFLLATSALAQGDSLKQSFYMLKVQMDSCSMYNLKLTADRKKQMITLAEGLEPNKLLSGFFEEHKQYGSALFCYMRHTILSNNLDSVYFYYRETVEKMERYEKEDMYILYPLIQEELIQWSIYNGYYELAIRTAKDLEQFNIDNRFSNNFLWTYQLLSMIYMMMDKPSESIKVAEKALALDIKQPITEKTTWNAKTRIYQQLIQCYSAIKEYDKSLHYCDKLLSWIEQMPIFKNDSSPSNEEYYDRQYLLISLWKMTSYAVLGDLSKAKAMHMQADTIFNRVSKGRFYTDELLYAKKTSDATYYRIIKDYEKAIKNTKESLDFVKELNHYPELVKGMFVLSNIYTEQGNHQKSNELRGKALLLSDSLNRAAMSKELNELWTLFEVDKALMEKERSELKVEKLQILIATISTVVLLLTAFIISLIMNNKKLKAKNQKLFDQQKEQESQNDLVNLVNYDFLPNTKEESLYDRIVNYILSSRRYTDPNVSRELMATELGTNRHYITEAIQQNANMNFSEFINNFRLRYAQLLLKQNDIQIKRVYLESGFTNRTTFSRLFRDKYGMTPSEYRACANEDIKNTREVYQYE